MNVRQQLSDRLRAEIARKDSNPNRIASQTRQPVDVINGYLEGSREIQFAELRPICDALKIELMRLLSPNFKKSHLTFRALQDQDKAKASQIENAFLILSDLIPQAKKIQAPALNLTENDPAMIQTEINSVLKQLRSQYSSVESFFLSAKLPILPISAGENGFDAFIMNEGRKAVVCVNRDKAPARIHFSLLHEIAHFLWHRERDIPVDFSIIDSYGKINESDIPEYVANKFAQQYIFPMEEIEKLAREWKNIANVSNMIAERRTTPDVLAFAICDFLKLSGKSVQYTQVRDEIKSQAGQGWGKDNSIMAFIEDQGQILKNTIHQARDEFSDVVWSEITSAWELNVA